MAAYIHECTPVFYLLLLATHAGSAVAVTAPLIVIPYKNNTDLTSFPSYTASQLTK